MNEKIARHPQQRSHLCEIRALNLAGDILVRQTIMSSFFSKNTSHVG